MKTHELKIKEKYFEEVLGGRKTFELRKDDRGYEVGDGIAFRVVGEENDPPCAVCALWKITYILRDCPEYGLMPGYCILGIKREESSEKGANAWLKEK